MSSSQKNIRQTAIDIDTEPNEIFVHTTSNKSAQTERS